MNIVRHTHQLAMELSTIAGVSLGKGFEEDAIEFYKQAFELEKKAAFMTSSADRDTDPHFILLRSAAALAFKAKLYQESERLMEICFAENPPAFIVEDLREITELIGKEKSGDYIQSNQHFHIEGILTNILAEENQITVKNTALSQSFLVVVPKNKLNEIVKNHWSNKVKIQARQTPHGVMVMEKISAAA